MRKPYEIIAIAASSKLYGNFGHFDGFRDPFLCNVIDELYKRNVITSLERHQTKNTINGILGNCDTLTSHLRDFMEFQQDEPTVITSSTPFAPNDLRKQFWAVLCMDLAKQGK